ncbi:MAG: PEGA domain-containing protein, partial [Brevundimonas sp.]
LNAPAGATILVDGRPYGMVGAAGAPLTPGRHEVVVEADGRRIHAQSIFVAAGARAEVRVP